MGEQRRPFACLNVCSFVGRIVGHDANHRLENTQDNVDCASLQNPSKVQSRGSKLLFLSHPKRFSDLFEIGDMIGEGAFGTVCRAKPTENGQHTFPAVRHECAVKTFKNAFKKGQPLEDINRSALELSASRCEEFYKLLTSKEATDNNIVAVHGQIIEEPHWLRRGVNALIMEVLEGPDLHCWLYERFAITSKQTPTQDEVASVTLQMFAAIHYLHRVAGCLHRDIKADNFGFSRPVPCGGVIADMPTLKLFDFGTVWILPKPVTEDTASGSLSLHPSGSWRFMAPEVLAGKCGPMSDVWSAGLIVHRLMSGKLPWNLGDCIGERSVASALNPKTLHVDLDALGQTSPLALDFVSSVLSKEPKVRATTSAALHHPWLRAASDDSYSSTMSSEYLVSQANSFAHDHK